MRSDTNQINFDDVVEILKDMESIAKSLERYVRDWNARQKDPLKPKALADDLRWKKLPLLVWPYVVGLAPLRTPILRLADIPAPTLRNQKIVYDATVSFDTHDVTITGSMGCVTFYREAIPTVWEELRTSLLRDRAVRV